MSFKDRLKAIEKKIFELIPHDKALHVIVGNIIFTVSFIILHFFINDLFVASYLSFTATFFGAICRELYDETFKKTQMSALDIIFTTLGSITPLLFIIFLL